MFECILQMIYKQHGSIFEDKKRVLLYNFKLVVKRKTALLIN